MRHIELTMPAEESRRSVDSYDDLERPIGTVEAETPQSRKVMINVDQIREFYPRKHGMIGTRISMIGGAGIPVVETYEEVKAAINGTNN